MQLQKILIRQLQLLFRLFRVFTSELIPDTHQCLAEQIQPPPLLGELGLFPTEPDAPYLIKERVGSEENESNLYVYR